MLKPCTTPQGDCGFQGQQADDAQPGVANLSAEAPDVDFETLLQWPAPWIKPPLGGGNGTVPGDNRMPVTYPVINNENYTGPQPCTELVVGRFGYMLSATENGECSPSVPPGPGYNIVQNPDWQLPQIKPSYLYPNDPQTASAVCPDGSLTTITIPAGTYHRDTVSKANQTALTEAKRKAAFTTLCINGTPSGGCLKASYGTFITAAANPPRQLNWTVSAGALPPGLLMTVLLAPVMGVDISGLPSATGDYSFTLTATDQVGNTRNKAFTISIISISTPILSDGNVGTAYSQQLLVAGGSGASTFAVTAGALPDGLTLSTSGLISGTPTGAGSSQFTVSATRSGATCTKSYILVVEEVTCPVSLANYALTGPIVAATYVASTDRVWVARQALGIAITVPSTGVVESNPVPGIIGKIVSVASSGRVFCNEQGANDVLALNAVTGAVEGTVTAPATATVLPVFDDTNNYVYVGGPELEIYNATTLALVSSTANLSTENYGGPAYVPSSNRLYIGVDGIGVRIYNPLTGANTGTIGFAAAYSFYGAVYSPEADRVCMLAYDGVSPDFEMVFINPNTDTVENTITCEVSPFESFNTTFRSANTGLIYVTRGLGGTTVIVNPLVPEVMCSIQSGATAPTNIAFATSNRTSWIANGGANRVEVFEE